MKEEVLSLENCTREVAFLSLLHWDEPSSLIFQLDLEGKALAGGSLLSLISLSPFPDPPPNPGGKSQLLSLLSCLVLGHHLTQGLAVAPVAFPVWCDLCIL